MVEQWKDIKGFEGLYQISSLGRVKSLNYRRSGKTKILKLNKHKFGYLHIQLHKDNKNFTYRVHRLVAEAFIPNSDNKPCIDHINTIRTDNRVENLRWVTHIENMNNPLTLEKHIKNSSYKRRNNNTNRDTHYKKPIIQFTLDGELVRVWNSVAEAEKYYGNKKNIYNCFSLKKSTKTAYNSTWEYYNTDRYLIAKMNKTIKEREQVA